MERAGRTSRGAVEAQLGCGRSRGEPDLLLRWGNRKRLRCVKIQVRDEAAAGRPATARDPSLLCRAPSPHRPLGYNTRNSEASAFMKAQQQQGIDGDSPERPRGKKKADNGAAMLSNGAASKDNRKGSGGGGGEGASSSSGSEPAAAAAWPNVVIALTAREKEEDFLAFKGTKLPQRPKKRAKLIQRTLNVSPGAWLCDLTLERYEVREKKVTKKAPGGLKAMGNMESDSE